MAATPPTTPNLIFILVDDLGWKDLGAYGSPFHETPHLDRLAAGGMRFTNAYAASPVCSPTRASALTGKYPATVGITQYIGGHNVGHLCDVPYLDRLPENEYTLPMAMRDHGDYQTWHVGKWHLGPREAWPDRRGFDVNIAAQHPEIRDRLHEKLKTWRNSVQALVPRKNPHWPASGK